MKQINITDFRGIEVLPNSFSVKPGSFDIAENAVMTSDGVMSKPRGVRTWHQFPDGQFVSHFFDYGSYIFALCTSALYSMSNTPATGQATLFTSSQLITVRKVDHGMLDQFWIADFDVSGSDGWLQNWPSSAAAFWGRRQITCDYVGIPVVKNGATAVATLAEHGMQVGDRINVTAGTGLTLGVKTLTAVTASTFTWVELAAAGATTGTYTTIDAFQVIADEDTVNVNAVTLSGATAASWLHYRLNSAGVLAPINSPGRSFEANQNLYFTTETGVMKLEDPDVAAKEAGVAPALDIQGDFVLQYSGATPLAGYSIPGRAVAYRAVFGRRDVNNNLVLGAPGDILVIRNVIAPASVSFNDPADTLTITQANHGLPNGTLVQIFDALYSGTGLQDTAQFAISNVTTNTFDITGLTTVTSVTYAKYSPADGRDATVRFDIPNELIDLPDDLFTEFFWRVYRSDQSAGVTLGTPESLPNALFRFIYEKNFVAGDKDAGYIAFTDILIDQLREGNAELYTNATAEGEAQENSKPPRCVDLTVFKNYSFYFNIDERANGLTQLQVPNDLANGDTITATAGVEVATVILRGNAANEPLGNLFVTDAPATLAAGQANVNSTNHGFLTGDTLYLESSSGFTGLAAGLYTITRIDANNFRFGSGVGGGPGLVSFEGREDSIGRGLVQLTVAASAVPTTTASEAIAATAQAIVKAINRVSEQTYARYASSVTDAPGKIAFQARDVRETVTITGSSDLVTNAFQPTLGTPYEAESLANVLAISKISEPEAVPLLNRTPVGSRNRAGLRCAALRDSLILIKEDGIFRLNGDSPSNFSVTALDNTIVPKAPDSAVVLNNSVYVLTNQGVVQITDNSVQIISRDIEPLLTAIFGNPQLGTLTHGVGYESERLYLLATIRENTTPEHPNIVYVYNYITQRWTTWNRDPVFFKTGFISRGDDKLVLALSEEANQTYKENKQQLRTDFSDEKYRRVMRKGQMGVLTWSPTKMTVRWKCNIAHGLKLRDYVTVFDADLVLQPYIPTNQHVVVTRVINDFTVELALTSNFGAVPTILTGNVGVAAGYSEFTAVSAVVLGQDNIQVTLPVGHGIKVGQVLRIRRVDSSTAAAFAANSVVGSRVVTAAAATEITIKTAATASANVSPGFVIFDDSNTDGSRVIIETTEPLANGWGIGLTSQFYVIAEAQRFIAGVYNTAVLQQAVLNSWSSTFLFQPIRTRLRTNPITAGDVTMLKQFGEFQLAFRDQNSASILDITFQTDSKTSVGVAPWNFRVDKFLQAVNFGGWGETEWGESPWGSSGGNARIYRTSPAVPMRINVPQNGFIGTFIQGIITHAVAGESVDLQALSFYAQTTSQRVTK